MKKTLILAAIMLIWFGPANAGELKVQVPLDDYKEIESRIEALENENNSLKREISSLESSATPQVSQPSATTQPSEEMAARLSALERENNQLKNEVQSLQRSQDTMSTDDDTESRLSSLENENLRLNQKIKAYKDRGVRVLDTDRRTARQVFRDMQRK